MTQMTFKQVVKVKGEHEYDKSASPLYRRHMVRFASGGSNTNDSIKERAAVSWIWHLCSRSNEVKTLHEGCLSWEPHLDTIVVSVPQVKVAKPKRVPVLASLDPHGCFFTTFGDYLGTTCPELNDNEIFDYSSKSLGGALRRRAEADKTSERINTYNWPVSGISAQSLRHGAITEMIQRIPPAHVSALSGHEFESSLFRYVASVAIALPGCRVLAGLQCPPHGQIGASPGSPRLSLLSELISVENKETELDHTEFLVEKAIDQFFQIDQFRSPQSFLKGGELRPFMHACFAAQIMHFRCRQHHESSQRVVTSLIACFGELASLVECRPEPLLLRASDRILDDYRASASVISTCDPGSLRDLQQILLARADEVCKVALETRETLKRLNQRSWTAADAPPLAHELPDAPLLALPPPASGSSAPPAPATPATPARSPAPTRALRERDTSTDVDEGCSIMSASEVLRRSAKTGGTGWISALQAKNGDKHRMRLWWSWALKLATAKEVVALGGDDPAASSAASATLLRLIVAAVQHHYESAGLTPPKQALSAMKNVSAMKSGWLENRVSDVREKTKNKKKAYQYQKIDIKHWSEEDARDWRAQYEKEKKEAEVKLEEKNKKRKTISLSNKAKATIAAVGTSLVQAMSPAKKVKREREP